jgi:hypothetical protein
MYFLIWNANMAFDDKILQSLLLYWGMMIAKFVGANMSHTRMSTLSNRGLHMDDLSIHLHGK